MNRFYNVVNLWRATLACFFFALLCLTSSALAEEGGRNATAEPATAEALLEPPESNTAVVAERVEAERQDAFNPYVITAHKHNFFLPLSYTSNVNMPSFELQNAPDDLAYKPYEVNFQISLKSQVNQKDLLFAGDAVFFGITMESWWQLYNAQLSSPFRETNYQPEVFYLTPLLWGPFNGKTALSFGLEHQSNGQLKELSRSWNRIYAELIYGRGSFVASLRPWYRLPEKRKESPLDAQGDDNPDIHRYFGNAQLSLGWKNAKIELASVIRGNLSTGKGAVDTTLTFPLSGKFRGMVAFSIGWVWVLHSLICSEVSRITGKQWHYAKQQSVPNHHCSVRFIGFSTGCGFHCSAGFRTYVLC